MRQKVAALDVQRRLTVRSCRGCLKVSEKESVAGGCAVSRKSWWTHKTTSMSSGLPSAIPQISQTSEVDRKLFATWQATLGSKATAQHRVRAELAHSTKFPKLILALANFNSIEQQGRIQSGIPKLWTMHGLVGLRIRMRQKVAALNSETAHSQKLPGLPESI